MPSSGATVAKNLSPVAEPETVATAIRIGNPRSWKKSLRGVRNTGGQVLDVTDEEIAEAKAVIGRDGIGCEPASAATLAGLRKLRAGNSDSRGGEVVAILTGHVLKDTNFIIRTHRAGGSTCALNGDEIVIQVPGSIANLGPGFDTLAVAVQLYLTLRCAAPPARTGCALSSSISSSTAKTTSSAPSASSPSATIFPFPRSTSRLRATSR